MKAIVEMFTQAHKSLVYLEKTVTILLLYLMIVLSFGQVVARNLFDTGFMRVEEILRIIVLWLTFLGAGLAAEYNRHVKIDVLAHVVGGGRAAKIIDTLAQIFAMIISSLLFYGAMDYINTVERRTENPPMTLIQGVPDWIFKMVIPYFFLVMAIRCLINIRRIIMGTHRRSIEP
ncbi:MAG: TRAP transporter small permease subunit [Thermodesulfobacteriota bacterium]